MLEHGEYFLDIVFPCSDNDTENFVQTEPALIEWQSRRPSLADLDFFNGIHTIDIPQLYEYDVTSSPFGVGAEIRGRTEIRQDNSSGDVRVIGSLVLTVPTP